MHARTVRMFGLAAGLALVTSVAAAQDSKPISFGAMAGLSLPMGDLGDAVSSGYNITGNVYLTPSSTGRLRFRGDVGYESFSAKDNSVGSDATFSVLSVTGNVIFPLGQASSEGGIRPYLIGGGGMYRGTTKTELLGASVSTSDTNLGIAVGGGLEFKLSGFSTFAEARFTNVFSEGDSSTWIPITFGIRF